jgi:hypothetical protein
VDSGQPAHRARDPSAADGRHPPPAGSCRPSQRPGPPVHQLQHWATTQLHRQPLTSRV